MPIYVYKCEECGHVEHDFQHKYVGSREIACIKCSPVDTKIIGKTIHFLTNNKRVLMKRDYNAEMSKIALITDFAPGYNPGIDEHFTSKADLMMKIKRKGLRPMHNDGSIASSRASGGLYGDEEFRSVMDYSKPVKDDDQVEYVELGPNEIPPGG